MVYNPYVNSGKTRASGLDFDVTSRFKIDNVGDLKVKLEGNYDLNFQTFLVGDNTWTADQKGTYDQGARLATKLSATLKSGKWEI